MPPDSISGTWSLRYTDASGTTPVAEVSSTGPIRSIIGSASSGSCEASPNTDWPGAVVSRLVPSASRRRFRSSELEAEMPTTATIAAIPMAMPIAESVTRSGLDRSP